MPTDEQREYERLEDAKLEAFEVFTSMPWRDLARHLTCTEVEDLRTALNQANRADIAYDLLIEHQKTDEKGDKHFPPSSPPFGQGSSGD